VILAPQPPQKYYHGFGRVVPQHEDRQSNVEIMAPFWHGEIPSSLLSPPPPRVSLLSSTPRLPQLHKLGANGFNPSVQSALPRKPGVHRAEPPDAQARELEHKSSPAFAVTQ
jgi:hypothetical protein